MFFFSFFFFFLPFHSSSTGHKLKSSRKRTEKKTAKMKGKKMDEISMIPSHSVAKPREEEKRREERFKNRPKDFKVKSFGKKKNWRFLQFFFFYLFKSVPVLSS